MYVIDVLTMRLQIIRQNVESFPKSIRVNNRPRQPHPEKDARRSRLVLLLRSLVMWSPLQKHASVARFFTIRVALAELLFYRIALV